MASAAAVTDFLTASIAGVVVARRRIMTTTTRTSTRSTTLGKIEQRRHRWVGAGSGALHRQFSSHSSKVKGCIIARRSSCSCADFLLAASSRGAKNFSSSSDPSTAKDEGRAARPSVTNNSSAPTDTSMGSPRTTPVRLILYDSLSKSAKNVFDHDLSPTEGVFDDGRNLPRSRRRRGVAVYACGPTVYAPAHLGHARTYVCLDVLRRVMDHAAATASSFSSAEPQPLFVLNITDVDDKILMAAAASSSSSEGGRAETPLELARRFEAEFWRDWDALNLLRPHVVTRVSEHVDKSIIPYIQKLIQNEVAYDAGDGDVYFDVQAFDATMQPSSHYGKLAPLATQPSTTDQVDAQSRTPEAPGRKRDPRDFALWKGRKPGEEVYWNSPFGPGRPGWHIECSAMIHAVQEQFNESHVFTLHAGGIDLKFPHHCNEIAQAEAYYGSNSQCHLHSREWIPHWMHTGHLYIDGLKMSKSLKNFITIQEMLSASDEEVKSSLSSPGDDFRMWCLSSSYRASVTYSPESIAHARKMRERIVQLLLDGEGWLRMSASFPLATKRLDDEGQTLIALALYTAPRCLASLTSDLDGPSFLRDLLSLVNATKKYMEGDRTAQRRPSEPVHASLTTIRHLLRLVGMSDSTTQAGVAATTASIASANVPGGERALINELSRFRAIVRDLALNGIRQRSNEEPDSTLETQIQILAACDDARDRTLPSLGIELFDQPHPIDDATGGVADGDGMALWRYCIPRLADSARSEAVPRATWSTTKHNEETDVRSVSPADFFRVGQYEGQFLEFDSDGLPTMSSDGTPVSNRLRKKLQKKLEKHLRQQNGGATQQ